MDEKQKRSGILSLLGEIRAEERLPVFLMLLNLFLILVAYYVIKVVREPLILSTEGGAQWKSYGAAAQAVALMAYIPLYGWFSSKVNRMKLILGVNLFFLVCIELFSIGVKADVPYIGIAFFVWVGIFSLSIIAQFWSLANDLYSEDQGKRLFPIIAIGATLGSPIGSEIASVLFDSGLSAELIMQVSAVLLILSMLVYWFVQTKYSGSMQEKAPTQEKLSKTGGFTLLFQSRYLLLIAALLLVLNIVNTTGEFILGAKVVQAADQAVASGADKKAFIGSFYGNYFFIVNIAAFLLQTFFVSRIVKHFGVRGALLLPPLISLGAYTTIAAGVGIAIIRWMKTAENAADYSITNTARAILWLPTSREEKYKAKQAVDTFVIRIGDLLSAAVVFAGTNWLGFRTGGFAVTNLCFVLLWIGIAFVLIKHYNQLSQKTAV